MLKIKTTIIMLLLSLCFAASASMYHSIDGTVPFIPEEPLTPVPSFLANPGTDFTTNFVYYDANITSNANQCIITVSKPVNIAFYFHDYSFYRSYEPAPSGRAFIDIELVQQHGYDGENMLEYPFSINVNRVTNVLSPARDTLLYLLPGTYMLTFKGIISNTGGSGPIKGNGTTPNSSNSMAISPHHLMAATMTAYAVAQDPSDGEFPDIPTPDCGFADTWETTTGKNSIYTFVSTSGDNTAGISVVDYFDDFGRSEETVCVAASPDRYDLVTYKEYDSYGRVSRQWLPAKSQSGTGAYMSMSDCLSASPATNGDNEPFGYPVYEPSPLNRVAEQYGAGQQWHQQQKRIRTKYLFNGTGELACRLYKIQGEEAGNMTISSSGNYANGKLQVVKTYDEDDYIVLEFKDMQDRTVLTRAVIENSDYADTYYIYDGLGRLRAVLPPELSAQASLGTVSPSLIDRYAYLYRYDGRDRLIQSKLPGASWCSYTYDNNDRLVFSADGEQQSRNERTFYVYDALGRECIRGTADAELSGDVLLLPDVTLGSLTCKYTGAPGRWMGYEVKGTNLQNVHVTNVNYYDTYSFTENLGLPARTPLYGNKAPHTRGLLTGTATARLKPASSGSSIILYDYCVIRYDERNRITHTETTNHLGGYDVEDIKLNHIGLPVERKLEHRAAQKPTQTEVYKYSYDHMSRLLKVTHQLNAGSVVTLTDNRYDGLGRLKTDMRNGNSLLKTDYTYNIRGWIKSITSGPLFSEKLYYNEDYEGNMLSYTGNISAMEWKADAKSRAYFYIYDGLSRLSQAFYYENGFYEGNYDTEYTYDRMGNILTLMRWGLRDNNQYEMTDNLTYSYNGNQVSKVSDGVTGPFYADAFHFRDGADAATEYTYDANGNMTMDLNKGISSIQYNLLNLPSKITYQNGNTASYIYSASGEKLSTAYSGSGNRRDDYCGNYIYENGTLKQIRIDGGYITLGGSTPQYHFYLKDHLGNNRVVTNAEGVKEQVNHYYPFGGLFGESTNGDAQRFKYNDKEFDRMNGLDWMDYGARHMDGIRFTTMDPLAEKSLNTTPYHYCHSNPMNRIDPDGKDDYYTNKGHFLFRDKKETDRIIIRNTFAKEMSKITLAPWQVVDVPIENMVLSAEAYSNIFTNILSQMKDVDVRELHNEKVSVTVWEFSNDNLGVYTSDQHNDAGLSFETLAGTGNLKNGNRVITAYMHPKGTEEKLIMNTVANIQNLLGVHEFIGHYKKGWSDHKKVVPFQRSHSTWKKTTNDFKKYNYNVYGKNL